MMATENSRVTIPSDQKRTFGHLPVVAIGIGHFGFPDYISGTQSSPKHKIIEIDNSTQVAYFSNGYFRCRRER